VPESFEDDLLRDLGGACAVGMPAHAVYDDKQRRVLRYRCSNPILVLLAPAQEADVDVLNAQE